jgi:hypothetical protein
LSNPFDRVTHGLANGIEPEGILLSKPNEQKTLGGNLAVGVEEGKFRALAFELFGSEQFRNRPFQCSVEGCEFLLLSGL